MYSGLEGLGFRGFKESLGFIRAGRSVFLAKIQACLARRAVGCNIPQSARLLGGCCFE